YPVGRPIAGRPWKTPAYGLGLMIGETTNGELIAGHTGGGPGSAVAVYHRLDKPIGTAAALEPEGTDATVEAACVGLLGRQSRRPPTPIAPPRPALRPGTMGW